MTAGAMLVRRLLQLPLVLAAVFAVTFTLMWLVPGNPMESEGRRPPPEIAALFERSYAMDDPVAFGAQYLDRASGLAWLAGRHDRPFDLGPSLRHADWTVNEIIAAGLPVSVALGALAMVFALVIGLGAGIVAGLRPGSLGDALGQGVSVLGISLPGFVVGSVLSAVFCAWLQWFPVATWDGWRSALLPALALSLPFAAAISRLVRYGMLEEMRSDHVRTALAKGRSRTGAAVHHAMKNALLPVLSYLGPATAAAMTGSFVVEKVFAVPGIGRHFVEGVLGKDVTLVMGIVLCYSTMLVLLNLAVDLLYRFVDPRIEAG
jgi:oligopeptide transport system permease protein